MKTDFNFEWAPGRRIKVSWSNDVADYHFDCSVEDDVITKVHGGGLNRTLPSVVQVDHARDSRGRHKISYHGISDEPWASMIDDAQILMLAEKRATRAFQEKADRDAAKIAEDIRRKAQVVREALPVVEALATTPDDALAAAYDAIQNAVW